MIRRLLESRAVWVVLAVLGIWSFGRIAARELALDPRFCAWPYELSVSAPRWAGPEILEPVRRELRRLGPVSLFDARFAGRVRASVESVPGVRGVRGIRRLWPNRYSVDLVLHRPVVVVLRDGRSIPVTADGVVLPVRPYARATRGLMRMTGVDEAPPAPGGTWNSPQLAEGLATVMQLAPHSERLAPLGLREVDVSGAEIALTGVVLVGIDGITVSWGRPLSAVGENTAEQKIGYLRIAARHLHQVRGLEIDVRWDKVWFREQPAP